LAEQVYNKPELTSVIRWFSPAYFLVASLRVAVAATRISQRMQYAVYAEQLAQPVANLLLILVFFFLGWGLSGAVAALSVSVCISVTLAWYHVRRLFPDVLSRQVKPAPVPREVFTFSLVACLAGGATVLNSTVDRLLVGYFQPAAEVGVYQAIAQSSILFAMIIGAFSTIFSPMIADLHQRGRTEELGELYKVSTKWGFYLSLPLFLVMCLAPYEVILVLFGPDYVSGALPLVILTVGQLMNVGSGSVGLLMIMTGNQRRWLVISGSMLLPTIALNWLLIPRFGLTGAALAATFSLGVLFLMGLLQVKRRLGIWPHDLRYLKGLLATILAAAALLLLRRADIEAAVLDVALSLVISFGVFLCTLVLLGLDAEDKEFIRSVWMRLGRLKSRG
jgi:O-antigen/teichoic acid export membrane protein